MASKQNKVRSVAVVTLIGTLTATAGSAEFKTAVDTTIQHFTTDTQAWIRLAVTLLVTALVTYSASRR